MLEYLALWLLLAAFWFFAKWVLSVQPESKHKAARKITPPAGTLSEKQLDALLRKWALVDPRVCDYVRGRRRTIRIDPSTFRVYDAPYPGPKPPFV